MNPVWEEVREGEGRGKGGELIPLILTKTQLFLHSNLECKFSPPLPSLPFPLLTPPSPHPNKASAATSSFSATRRKSNLCSSSSTSRSPSIFLPSPTKPTHRSKIPLFGPKLASLNHFLVSSFRSVVCDGSSTTCSCESAAEESKPSGLRRLLLIAVVWKALAFACCGASLAAAAAAADSIRVSGFGLQVATALRRLGWADELVVFVLATLPVLELRGAIPVGYWMQIDPLAITVLAVLGNMVPVPFIILYLKKFASFVSQKSDAATRLVSFLFERAKEKAAPVEEFKWLGLMLFVAVPFPGTGAWTGAIVAAILDMPFWSAFSANLVGVVLAGLLVNLLVNLGLKYAILTGFLLFFASTAMWTVLRSIKKSIDAN